MAAKTGKTHSGPEGIHREGRRVFPEEKRPSASGKRNRTPAIGNNPNEEKEEIPMKKMVSLILALMMALSMLSFASAEQGATVTVGLANDPGNLGPFQGMSGGRIGILFTTYEMLMAKGADGEYGGVLLKELTPVDDLTYDVEIYDYIVDQAGNPLTASDIKFCYETAQSTGNLPKLSSIASVEVLSDYVVRFTFTALAAGDLEALLMECPIVTQAAYEASADQMATDPVSTTPYQVSDFKAGSSITYKYTGNYWQKDELTAYTSQHNVDEIVFKIIPEAVTLNNALASGEIDISSWLDAMYVGEYLGKEGYQAVDFQDNLTMSLTFNANVFTTVEERKAIAAALDVDNMITFAYNGTGARPAHDLGNSNYPEYNPEWDNEEYFPYDEENAASLIEAAGLSGKTFKIMYVSSDQFRNVAEAIQADLSFVGVNVELKPYDSNLFSQYKFADDQGEWDMMLDTSGSSGLLVNVWKLHLDRNDQVHGKTVGYVSDDHLQELMDAALADNNAENVEAVHDYVMEQAYEIGLLVPVTYLIHTDNIKTPATCFRGQILPGACEY